MERKDIALFTLGIGVGALTMFLLDPQLGRRRRALASDKAKHFARTGSHWVGKNSRHFANKAKGTLHKLGRKLEIEEPGEERVLRSGARLGDPSFGTVGEAI